MLARFYSLWAGYAAPMAYTINRSTNKMSENFNGGHLQEDLDVDV